ncbi:hypothetical protein RRF57_004478 [Xylaria bambusicola]|uniref:Uncharacterized protein n=1 Tax=Xylaria bambusicola TaxID=326684 RepID=A0AAN7Z6H4_9PEZI
MVKLCQQFVTLGLHRLKMLVKRSDLLLLRFDESYTLIYNDVFRQALRLSVGEGGQKTRKVLLGLVDK